LLPSGRLREPDRPHPRQEGLGEIRQTQSGLALVLACLGLLLWLWCFWIIVQPRP
jgi:hypothetical protein